MTKKDLQAANNVIQDIFPLLMETTKYPYPKYPPNIQCVPCSSGYMAPGYGSTVCIQCGTGTVSAEAASHCASKCLFYVNDTIYYSIQDLEP